MSTLPSGHRLGIVFPYTRDAAAWAEQHVAGKVPDRWPYGLNKLSRIADEVIPLQARPLRTIEKGRLVGRLSGLTNRLLKDDFDVCIAWEEYTAAKMMAQYPNKVHFSGVIWATDLWKADGSFLRKQFVKSLLLKQTGLWCLSQPQVDIIASETKGRVPVGYLPFGVDEKFFRYSKLPEKLQILSLGVDRDRDPETLLAALEIVHRRVPDAAILVQTDSRRAMPRGVTRLERVPHARLREFYASSSAVVISTRPNLHASGMTVALEAGASGRPVVISNTPGMEDYVVHGETGLLVRPTDPEGLANATTELLLDREYASHLGAQARIHVERSHTSEMMMQRLGEMILTGLRDASSWRSAL